ncbi:MAG: dTDP-4-dehydrorhamnose reductase [Saprospiraceae bacterium]|nr:dTDP-4-dehydrorhamnose reductase [Saprospiraceae bacterium]
MKKVFVIGSSGMLGLELQACLNVSNNQNLKWFFLTRAQLDLQQLDSCPDILSAEKPDWLINLAAYTQVDQAESEPEIAHEINARGPGKLAAFCEKLNCRFLHISTDYVYGGLGNTPFGEDAPLHPMGVYAKSKAAGEQAILEASPSAIILRTSWLYGPNGKNFFRTMLNLGRERDFIQVVHDQIGSPTYTADLAQAIIHILGQNMQTTGGIYNYSNEGAASWYDFAWNIMLEAGLECRVEPVTTAAFPRPAPRPAFSLMSKQKIRDVFGLDIPHWQDGLRRCLKRLP